MKDQILKSYVDSFAETSGYSELHPDIQFEKFVNFCVVSKQYPRDFDIEVISVGETDDIGIDGIAITVNGNIIQAKEEIDYFILKNGYLDVSFTFIQSKSSPKFKGDQVGSMIFGIKTFFDPTAAIPENREIQNLRAVKDKIYAHSINFDEPPELKIYFVTTGEWKEPKQITGRVHRELQELESKKLFRSLDFNFYDAERLKDTYRELRRKTIKEIDFPNHVALPEIPHVRQSFVGSLCAKEYIKLITDSEGKLQKSLFEDNVRDFQGHNKVNADIEITIKDTALQAALSILNNGITIIAKKIDPIGAKLKLTDFQIVNGCQSSYVLYEQRARLESGTHIVVKFIETTDQDLSSKVIKATNKQTIVTDEAFESLSPFHKDLEEFYKAHSKMIIPPIHYERRSKQYEGVPNVSASQVITLTFQIKAYVATTLAQPHSTHRYYGELLEANRSKMFRHNDNKEPYYLSSLIFNRLERAFKNGKLDRRGKPFKYQVLYLVHRYHEVLRKKRNGYGFDQIASEYCEEEKYLPLFKAAIELVLRNVQSLRISWNDAARSRDFTSSLRTAFEKELDKAETSY
jgi:hypothetical protein